MNMKLVKTFLGASVVITLSGCGSLFAPMGADKFDCNRKQDPSSPYCRSFRSVENGTNAPIPPSRFDREFKMADSDALNNIAPDGANKGALPTQGTAVVSTMAAVKAPVVSALPHQTGGPSLDGQPVRVGPVIQRVLINRWVDDDDMLHAGTVVYREVIAPHWAGFDPVDSGNPYASVFSSYRQNAVYPHRESDEPAPAKKTSSRESASASDGSPAAAASDNPQQSAPTPSPAPEFVQPGATRSGNPVVPPTGPNGGDLPQ